MITNSSRYSLENAYEAFDPARAVRPINGVRPHRRGPLVVRCEHRFIASERLDHLANRYYEDPLLFWLLCDAAPDIFPDELTIPGRILRVPLNQT